MGWLKINSINTVNRLIHVLGPCITGVSPDHVCDLTASTLKCDESELSATECRCEGDQGTLCVGKNHEGSVIVCY